MGWFDIIYGLILMVAMILFITKIFVYVVSEYQINNRKPH